MLRSLTSSLSTFKSIQFRAGLNILIADRSVGDDDGADGARRTRNGAGKSSVVDLVHFLLGGKPEGGLKSDALAHAAFTLSLDVGRDLLAVKRSLAEPKQVSVRKGDAEEVITNTAWCHRLGDTWFGLTGERAAGAVSYRQLMAYFARRRRDGGYDEPVRTIRGQSVAAQETQLAHLFGLNAELVRRLHQSKASLKQVQTAQKALTDGDKEAAAGQRRADLEAQLEAQIAAATLAHTRLQDRVASFNVLPAFRELEGELAGLNQEVRDLSDQDVIDTELIEVNNRALSSEDTSNPPELARLFSEANVVFPTIVSTRYEEVAQFHDRLIENRRAHLEGEMAAAQKRIRDRQPERQALENRRRQIVNALRASGPADELLRLRDELSVKAADLRGLEGRLQQARSLDDRETELKLEIEEHARSLKQDRRERSALVEEASTTFSEISQRLYETPGQLAISATDAGLKFLPKSPADASAGIMNMEIFCFDLTIATLGSRRGLGPGFLIHDSHLFEPVDGRQFARALRIGSQFAADTGVQYIVALNSDELARAEKESGETFQEFVLPTTLSDTPEGGLFGIRFE